MPGLHHVVIVGGGFGGLSAAQELRKAPVRVTLVDQRNFHLFQPLLYQVATGGLSPSNIAATLRVVLRRQKNVRVLLGEVRQLDLSARRVVLDEGELSYDSLIVAAGAGHSYFGHDEWEPLAPGLKTVEDALEIRRRVLLAFEAAERCGDPAEAKRWLSFVVVGGGATGVELAGALGEMARYVMRRDFRRIDASAAEIHLVEGLPRVLQSYVPKLSEKAVGELQRRGVQVHTGAMVVNMDPECVTCKAGEKTFQIAARTVLWAAGVAASPLARQLAQGSGAELDRSGRIQVLRDLSLPNHEDVYAVGDMVHLEQNGELLPGVAQVAMQQGRYAARQIVARLRGRRLRPFHYVDLGNMATIGRGAAVAEIGRVKLSGYLAWLAWLFVHLMKLVGFGSRVLTFLQWTWHYVTWSLSTRLITGRPLLPEEAQAKETKATTRDP